MQTAKQAIKGRIFTTGTRVWDANPSFNKSVAAVATRSHFSYSSPGTFAGGSSPTPAHRHDWKHRGFTVGIGGPVGSGKTALVLALTKRLESKVPRKYSFVQNALSEAILTPH